jgi:uncharacterized membrane protein YfcA
VLGLGFGGGWVAGALGLGGGVIFNPLLLSMGVPPKVSSATGVYLITFSKLATCLIYFLNGELQIDYALWVSLWDSVGAVIGLSLLNFYVDKIGRQSIIVAMLTFVMFISVVAVPYFGITDLVNKVHQGESIVTFKSLC